MTHPTPADTDALAYALPAEAFHNLMRNLRDTFPPPPDCPIDRKNRDHAIIAQVSSFRPADAGEALFVAQIVAASEQWADCLRWAQDHLAAGNYTHAEKCGAQAFSMSGIARGRRSERVNPALKQ